MGYVLYHKTLLDEQALLMDALEEYFVGMPDFYRCHDTRDPSKLLIELASKDGDTVFQLHCESIHVYQDPLTAELGHDLFWHISTPYLSDLMESSCPVSMLLNPYNDYADNPCLIYSRDHWEFYLKHSPLLINDGVKRQVNALFDLLERQGYPVTTCHDAYVPIFDRFQEDLKEFFPAAQTMWLSGNQMLVYFSENRLGRGALQVTARQAEDFGEDIYLDLLVRVGYDTFYDMDFLGMVLSDLSKYRRISDSLWLKYASKKES